MIFFCYARKIKIVSLLYVPINDLIMGYLRINLFLLASISFTRWVQKYLIHGNCQLYNMFLICAILDFISFLMNITFFGLVLFYCIY
jgi:hypothetical protein